MKPRTLAILLALVTLTAAIALYAAAQPRERATWRVSDTTRNGKPTVEVRP